MIELDVKWDPALWDRAVSFHGHVCPGVVAGFRASVYAMGIMELQGNISGTHLVIAENDLCGLDGVQVVTGCTVGNDGLIIDNRGKQAFNYVSRNDGRGVRVVLRPPLWGSDDPVVLHQRVKAGVATPEEKQQWLDVRGRRGCELMALGDSDLFDVREIRVAVRPRPRQHPLVRCARCGEEVMQPWTTVVRGMHVCTACSERGSSVR